MANLLITAILANTVMADSVSVSSFNSHQVYRVVPTSTKEVQTLRQLQKNNDQYSFWNIDFGINSPVNIMVPPQNQFEFVNILNFEDIDYELTIDDVQDVIDKQIPDKEDVTYEPFNWERYQTLDEIYNWFQSLKMNYSNIVKTIDAGTTYEGRPIRGIKISHGPGKRAIFIQAGICANEWIGTSTATYIANQLLTSTDLAVRQIAESNDWYIFPVFNPDGYVFSFTNNRMWRKTRQPYGSCVGADLNSNWDYHWMDGGASNQPCSENFAGSAPFSEIEARSMADYISSIASDLDVYISFRSYSQLLLVPFGHDGNEVPANNDEMLRIGRRAVNVLSQRYGTNYTVGNTLNVQYFASGTSTDWVLGTHRNIRLVYTYELRDTGKFGYLLPPEQIIPTGEETLDSVVEMVQEVNAAIST